MNKDDTGKVVMLRPIHDKKKKRDINQEPEMQELKRMIRDGELDPERTIDHLQEESKSKDLETKLQNMLRNRLREIN